MRVRRMARHASMPAGRAVGRRRTGSGSEHYRARMLTESRTSAGGCSDGAVEHLADNCGLEHPAHLQLQVVVAETSGVDAEQNGDLVHDHERRTTLQNEPT